MAIADNAAVDLVTSLCTSGGNDPDEPAEPLFAWPRCVFHLPQRVQNGRPHSGSSGNRCATREMIRSDDPDEWENGEAALLHFYVSETLKRFPSTAVESVRATTDLRSRLLTIHSLYTKLRR